MLRRRPFRRRPLSPLRSRRPLLSKVHRALIRANSLMADGQFTEAAIVFERLSDQAKQRGRLVRAADLALQASRAHFAADGVKAALEWAGEAMRLLVRGGRAGRVPRVLSRMTTALRGKGYGAEADELEREVAQALEDMGLTLDEVKQRVPQVTERHGTLPARCSGCGGALVPDEIEWHDAQTAECPYCGTIAKAS